MQLGGTGGQVYLDAMFNYQGAAVTALTQFNSGVSAAAGNYTPKADGALIGIEIQVGPQAATSLTEGGYIQLTSTAWAPVNQLNIWFAGFGIATAPTFASGNVTRQMFPQPGFPIPLNLPIKTSIAIAGFFQMNTGGGFTASVTPNLQVQGIFRADKLTAT